MKSLTLILCLSCLVITLQAGEPNIQWLTKSRIQSPFKLFSKKQPPAIGVIPSGVPYSEFDLFVKDKTPKPEKVVRVKTLELSRKAFQKWEQHDCGIKMRGNYMKVTYQTFYSDGSSIVWDREYRS